MSSRKSGGTLVSFIAHVAFAASILTLANKGPEVLKPHIDEHRIEVYVDKPIPERTMQTPATSTNASASLLPSAPPLIAPPDIPTSIPDMSSSGLVVTNDYAIGPHGGEIGIGTVAGVHTDMAPNVVMDGLQVDKPVMLLPNTRAPRDPELLRASGVQDTVVAMFVVDVDGRVEPNSFEANTGPNPLFIASVRDALFNMTFKPAEANGHRVRQRVVQAFVFSLTR